MKIGNLEINGKYFLAPMAGVTDLPFRILCSEYGAALTCTEMISAKAITYGNKKTEELMKTDDGDHPLALQLFGSEPEIMAEAASLIGHISFEILDINMGCPMPKIVNNGEGSALMKNPELVYRIVEAVRGATSKPVTVKIRAGYDSDNKNAVEVALAAQDGGVSAITVHGRTREQLYEGRADWDIIRKVKEMVHIPVIGNGDVTDVESAERMFKETGC
ncbi:MAG: tRNA-dihydrouridine synthase family protein, partial [Lachnospiraceae bacterium]|nr:tRNA-dihydrouridine synthase family protein [Lachnospiraceae bacterium]